MRTSAVNMTQEADETRSVDSWDDHIDNWTEFCKELKGELPKVKRAMQFVSTAWVHTDSGCFLL